MRDWLRGGRSAARLAAGRADLWFPGALVAFAFVGWAGFLAVVASPPNETDALYLGIRLAGSAWWPWNVVALVVAGVLGVTALLLAIAFGEVALLAGLSTPDQSLPSTVPRAMRVLSLAAGPVLLLAVALLWVVAPAFEEAFRQPDPTTPYLLRVLVITWPALMVIALVGAAAQAVGAMTLRLPWRAALSNLTRRPQRALLQAALTMSAFVGIQLLTVVLLSTLWQPLASRLAEGRLAEPSTAILLLGFVWIWLVLVVLAGVVQAWISAWWSEELARGSGGRAASMTRDVPR